MWVLLVTSVASAVADADGDGVVAGADCDDSDATVFPGAPEICDLRDSDCDGQIDEGFATDWYVDLDGDGFGDKGQVQPEVSCTQPAAHVSNRDDCDDTDAGVHPHAPERCNGLDDDCDDDVDLDRALDQVELFPDNDADGFGAILPTGSSAVGCAADGFDDGWYVRRLDETTELSVGRYVTDGTDCNDSDPNVNPGVREVCDLVDNNCDGEVDEARRLWYLDNDGDGVGDDASAEESCTWPGAPWVAEGGDCDDTDPDRTTSCDDGRPAPRPPPTKEEGCACDTGASPWGLVSLVGALAVCRRRPQPVG